MLTRRRSRVIGRLLKGKHGFTLVEILVAAMLLLIVMAGVVPFFLSGLAQASSARYRSTATNIAREKMENIRRLDYREIVEDELAPGDPLNLSSRFGDSKYVPERDMTFFIDYEVDDLEGQAARSVQVTVSWEGPPFPVSSAVVKTVIAEQYVGPKMGWLEISPTAKDNVAPGESPFLLLRTNGTSTTIKCHIAQSDWFLAYESVSLPLPAPNNIRLEYLFRDNAGAGMAVHKVDNTALHTINDGTRVTDIYFEDSFDAREIPDGYWNLQATMFNAYDEPGNTWTLRVRVEKGPPEAPVQPSTVTPTFAGTTGIDALATSDTSVVLTWIPGRERDRESYVVERREVSAVGAPLPSPLGDWVTVAGDLPANTTVHVDAGSLDLGGDPALDQPPCGRPAGGERYFEYRVYGVDTGGRSAPDDPHHASTSPQVALGGVVPTTKVTVPAVTGLLQAAAQAALDATRANPSDPLSPGLGWTVTEAVDGSVPPGTVLTQHPVAGTMVEQGSTVALTVAKATAAPQVKYTVTFKKTDNPGQHIYIHDGTNTSVFDTEMKKQDSVVTTLSNGHYNISYSASGSNPFQSFDVNGAALTVTIP